MVNLIKNVIKAGGYKLSDIQHKVKKLYLMGDITEEEMNSLLQMASDGVNTDAERPETLAILRNMSIRMENMEARLSALEASPDEGDSSVEDGGDSAEYEAWQPWDGLSDKYQLGAVVKHNDKVWKSVFSGQNVWEPGAAGTAALWAEYTDGGAV